MKDLFKYPSFALAEGKQSMNKICIISLHMKYVKHAAVYFIPNLVGLFVLDLSFIIVWTWLEFLIYKILCFLSFLAFNGI